MINIKQRINNWLVLLKMTFKDYKYNKKHIQIRMRDSLEMDFATLRMYSHMLDKGMNNPNFEKGHSLTVYKTAKTLQNMLQSNFANDSSFNWVNTIINRFENAQNIGRPELNNIQPITYSLEEQQFCKKFILSRTSCRNFAKQQIPTNILENIVKLAIDAPNGCCRQVVRYHITQDQYVISEAIPCIAGITNFSKIPCLVCVSSNYSFYDIIDKNLQYVDASLSAENFILGASIYGVYGTMCNFFHASPGEIKKCKKLFNVPEVENIVLFIAIGYPINIPEKPVRRNLEVFYKNI